MGETRTTEAKPPLYQCHKRVRAFKVTGQVNLENEVRLMGGGCSATVDREFIDRHRSIGVRDFVGGYYVLYAGGYESWSPGDVFEAGYTRIGEVEA